MTGDQEPEKRAREPLSGSLFDVIIIGAGVVGCAVARRFALEGAHVGVVEKASDILDGASKANSAILHTGFDAPSGSLELACIKAGYEEYQQIHRELNLPLENTGAYVVAWNGEEEGRLGAIVKQAHTNGVMDVGLITGDQLGKSEPNLAKNAKAAIAVPRESIIDPWSAPYAYLHQALMHRGEIFLSCEIVSGRKDDAGWILNTTRGSLRAKYVINCAGLYGDKVDRILLGASKFTITPRKGQFVVFDKAAAKLVNSIILPVPTARTKGIVICRTVFGNILVGPTAEDQPSRTDASTSKEALQGLIRSGIVKLPALASIPVTATYAGLRPASEHKDYQIEQYGNQGFLTVGAIRSTGLSGALGIAHHVYELYTNSTRKHDVVAEPKIPKANILSQNGERCWKGRDAGEIVCHCELVTKSEIEKALEGKLAARSLAGLKRQTRVTMGRCQGFFCSARLAELTLGKFDNPLSEAFDHE